MRWRRRVGERMRVMVMVRIDFLSILLRECFFSGFPVGG